ncbi:helix-turn-helix domain-containing protein [Streptomyces sp. NPDC006012]|uniref:AraC-like ligand-binding domain-containing protein n=1 Tax=Streptomyces sp. NPDC006012 TaxID=3364739 RepID=UPI0036CCE834
MLTTVLDTARLRPGERTAAWAEVTGLALVNTLIRFLVQEPDQVSARIRTLALGPVQLSVMSYTPLSSRRTARLIRQSDPEQYQLGLTVAGHQRIEQARSSAALGPGELVLYDSSRPFTAVSGPQPAGTRTVLLQFPRALMPLPEADVAPLCGTALDSRSGVGRLLGLMLNGLVETHGDLTPGDTARLGNTAIDLTAALLAHHSGRPLPDGSRQRALFQQIGAFIAARLHDPGLKPGTVAAAHFISTRYLHRIFQQHGTTVGEFVRQQRISRCRRDLADPAQRTVPVAVIGARWGYPAPSDFTRAFRTAVGLTPSEYRAISQAPRSAGGRGEVRGR